jgi:hypothetical protein
MKWLTARLREPSTWRGLIWLLTACGVTLRPEVWEQVTAIGMATAGLLGVLTSEAPKTARAELPAIELLGKATLAAAAPDPALDSDRMRESGLPTYPATPLARPVRTTESTDSTNPSTGWNG